MIDLRMRRLESINNSAMEEGLSSLITKVDRISIVLPERYPKNWADIQNEGHRKHVYGGELLNLALVVSLSEKNGQPVAESAETWKALSIAGSAGYSTPEDSPSANRSASLSFSQQRSQSVDCPDQAAEAEAERDGRKTRSSRGTGRRFSESSAPHTENMRCLSFTSVPVTLKLNDKGDKSVSKKVSQLHSKSIIACSAQSQSLSCSFSSLTLHV